MFLKTHNAIVTDTRCAFAAQGSELTDDTMTINSSPILFEQVDLNICGGYDNNTGIFYSLTRFPNDLND